MNDEIIIFIICFLIINLIIKNKKNKKYENFTETSATKLLSGPEPKTKIDDELIDRIKTSIDAFGGFKMDNLREYVKRIKYVKESNPLDDKPLVIEGDFNVFGNVNLLPIGTIIMYNSLRAPQYWAICDGSVVDGFQTPDLRGKFLRMWNDNINNLSGNNTSYEVLTTYIKNNTWTGKNNINDNSFIFKHKLGNTGGSDLISLTANEIPPHTHNCSDFSHTHNTDFKKATTGFNNGTARGGDKPYYNRYGYNDNLSNVGSSQDGKHTHTITEIGGEKFNNQPPYYVLTYIIRIK